MISFTDAIEQTLLEQDVPLVTDYDVFLTAWTLFEARQYQNTQIKRLPKDWDVVRSRGMIRKLVNRRTLAQDQDFKSGVWRLVQSTRAADGAEAACIADPFCYVSHLSAMQRFGLTERTPQELHLTRPARTQWNSLRDAKVAREVPSRHEEEARSLLLHFGLGDALRRRPVTVHETKYPAKTTTVRGLKTRVAEVGATFIDMLEAPHLCGGMQHVLDVWEAHAPDWLDRIMDAADAAPSGIVKVRAGYILSERMGVTSTRIDAWRAFAQRGGSRKLDPSADYRPVFSETWMISLNV
ncbi:hypothetical protein ACIQTU_10365 [Brevundimonas sp. NPDC090276]|uniref:type IV toxin-antitoxin system AbiEi family antitoxin domain-containing protein n=1 Tax=Brevundimonas sp. NPDC090276 TaxID=3363956 RepID=UPI00383A0C24